MRDSARRSWIVVAIVAVVVLAGAFAALRWALDPAFLKAMAEARLSAALGQPVRIKAVRIAFLPALIVDGTDILVGGTPRGAGAPLEIHAIRMHPRLLSILERPIVIDRIDIDGLALHARRDTAGRWILPLPSGSASVADTSSPGALDVAHVVLTNGQLTIAQDRPGGRTDKPIAAIENLAATVHHAGALTQLDALTASVGRSNVAGNGSVGPDGLRLTLRWTDLKASDLPPVFAFLGTPAPSGLAIEGRNPLALELRIDRGGAISASGRIAADRAALGTLAVTSFASPLVFARNRLTLDPMVFQAYSGTGRGHLAANLASSPASWAFDADLRQVDIDRFLSANTSAKGKVSGMGTLSARLRGTALAPFERNVAGTVTMAIANGAIHNFPLLSALYSALKIGGGGDKDLHFETLSGTFTVANARATTTDLVAKTGEMTLTAAGTVGFDQAIALTAKAAFSPAKSDEIVHSIKELSDLRNGSGEIEVPLTISGSLAAPHFAIDVVGLARHGAENELKRRLGDRLKDLFKKIK
jgi:uncharacterized protein involved in outer membrane biogenesis